MNMQAQPIPMSLDELTEKYVALRDKIKAKNDAHKAVMEPFDKMLETLNSLILSQINANGAESVKTKHGTVYKIARKSATIADAAAFRRHVIGAEDWDLVDWRANATAVARFIDDNNTVPPGVNYNTFVSAGVRRPNSKE